MVSCHVGGPPTLAEQFDRRQCIDRPMITFIQTIGAPYGEAKVAVSSLQEVAVDETDAWHLSLRAAWPRPMHTAAAQGRFGSRAVSLC
jgi:hypothetical protein